MAKRKSRTPEGAVKFASLAVGQSFYVNKDRVHLWKKAGSHSAVTHEGRVSKVDPNQWVWGDK